MSAERIRGFLQRLELEAADRVVPTRSGVGILADAIPDVYDSNYLSVESAPHAGAATLAAEAEVVLADRHHRRVVVHDGTPGLAGEFAGLGYELATHLVLAHTRPPDRLVDTGQVREVELDELLPARTVASLREPWGDAEIAGQLNEAKRRLARAVDIRFFAAFVDGRVAGWCELREHDGIAQIEDVEVLQEFRGRGLGRAVVQHALDEGARRADLVFLEALADDWPRQLYAKLGFTAVGHRDVYTRLPGFATRLRLRTPRLELRLPTVAQLRALYRVAEQGIHDPAVMPFEVPWTDSLNEADFLVHHLARDDRRLELVAFLDGEPVGVQALHLSLPEVSTGSWLGAAHQGQGLGTEMRAAVLTLAFEQLGATLARTGAFADNAASLGVSRKLGYRLTQTKTVDRRGVPAEHPLLELRREEFRSPVPVEVAGSEHLRPLLEAT